MPASEILLKIYYSLAGIAYLGFALGTAVAAIALMMSKPREVLAEIKPQRLVLATGVVVIQLVVSILAVVGDMSTVLRATLLSNWIVVVLAMIIYLPGHVWCREPEQRSQGLSLPHRIGGGAVSATLLITLTTSFFLVLFQFLEVKVVNPLFEIDEIGIHFWAVAGVALVAAPVEEIIFRLGLQRLLEKSAAGFRSGRMAIPVFASSLVWAMGHAGMVVPPGVKELQILLIGLILGWTRLRFGFGPCVGAHLSLNIFSLAWEFYNQTSAG